MDSVSFENQKQFYSKIDEKGLPTEQSQTSDSTLFGMTCDGMDIITQNLQVPNDLQVNDWLCISGMGAYTYGCKSEFNGMKSTSKIFRKKIKLEKYISRTEETGRSVDL